MPKLLARIALGISGSPLVIAFIYGNVVGYQTGFIATGMPWYNTIAFFIALFVDLPLVLIGIGVGGYYFIQGFKKLWGVAFPVPVPTKPALHGTTMMREKTENELAHEVLGDEYFA